MKSPSRNKALRRALMLAVHGSVTHALSAMTVHVSLRQQPGEALGTRYLDARHPEKSAQRLVRRL